MINLKYPNKNHFFTKMLARKIAPKFSGLFQTFLLFYVNKKSAQFFYLLIFHMGRWSWESKNIWHC